MSVPPESIHLHKHNPLVASPPSLGLKNRLDQVLSELCSWCWTLYGRKPLPSRLSLLERATHGPDNLPLIPWAWQPASSNMGLTALFFSTLLDSAPTMWGQQQGFNTHSHRDDSGNNKWAWNHSRQQPTLKHDTDKIITHVSGSSKDIEWLTDYRFQDAWLCRGQTG